MQELIKKIEQWAIDREIDNKGTVEGQSIKTAEEISELIKGISKDNIDLIKDSIGDVFVTLVIGNMLDKKLDIERLYRINEQSTKEDRFKLTKIKMIFDLGQDISQVAWEKYGLFEINSTLRNIMLIAQDYNLDFKDCVESSYKEIANREGEMVDGVFVKKADLKNGK